MASSNKTTNYNLSQYIGTDKPTYLGDYNSDMNKIDAQMKVNSDAIGVNASQIETVSTTASNALQNANTAQSTADSASSVANSALEKAIANETSISAIEEASSYKVGDVIRLGTNKGGGYLTGGRLSYNFNTIYLPKNFGNVKVRISSGSATIRQNGQTVSLGSLTGSETTVSRSTEFGNGINIIYTATSVLNTSLLNNDSISVLVTDLEITLDQPDQ